jgi:hypothetical protein
VNVKEYATLYISKGWPVVPLTSKTKDCYAPNWQNIVFSPDDFQENDNIGIKQLGGLIDIDLDSDEVVALASDFLPPTNAIYGRKSKPLSHWLYKCPNPPKKTIAFTDLGAAKEVKSTLIEIRVNHQSMAPPSIHPEGEDVCWETDPPGNAAELEYSLVLKSVRLVATAAMIVRYYVPPGHRQFWILPLCGVLRHLGLTEEEAMKCIGKSAKQVGDIVGKDLKDRIGAVRSTYSKGEDDPLASENALVEFMLDGKPFLKSLKKIWGTEGRDHRGFLTGLKSGTIIPNSQDNVLLALSKLNLEWYEDIFSHRLMVDGVPLDDAKMDRLWLEIDKRFHFQPNYTFFQRVLMDAIRQKPVHPVLDYLNSLEWDGVPRIDNWLTEYGEAEESAYTKAIGAIVLVAAVRRVRVPGCKFDEMLIIESSKQGVNKSTALHALVPFPWLSEDLPLGANSKEIIERTGGKWVIEAQEMRGSGREPERLKSFLSRQVDGPVRMAYGRLSVEVKRQFIIIGTTNQKRYLTDPTGNRRFWPVEVKIFDVERIRKNRDQLWAEAAAREAKKETIRLSPELYETAEEEQENRRHGDPWEVTLRRKYEEGVKWRIGPEEVWDELNIPIERRSIAYGKRLSDTMEKLGFRKMTVRIQGKLKNKYPIKGWGRDPDGIEQSELEENDEDIPF